jgi:hypothetical protein
MARGRERSFTHAKQPWRVDTNLQLESREAVMKLKHLIVGICVFVMPGVPSLIAQDGTIVATGTFHGAAHQTSGRATIYQTSTGDVLRITHFKTSNGPNVHVLLVAASDAKDDENLFAEKVDHVDLGSLKGNEGDQNYPIPSATDVSKYKTVSIFCERFNANFGAAPLEK